MLPKCCFAAASSLAWLRHIKGSKPRQLPHKRALICLDLLRCCLSMAWDSSHPLGGLLLLLDRAPDKEAPLLLQLLQGEVELAVMRAQSLPRVAAGEAAACVAWRCCRTDASAQAANT